MNDNHTLGGPGRTQAAGGDFYLPWSTGPLMLETFSSSPELKFETIRAAPREETDWRNLPRCDYCRQLAVRFLASQYVLICDDRGGCLACGAPLEFESLSDHEHVKTVGVPMTVQDEGVHIQLMAIDDASATLKRLAFERIAQDASELKLAIGETFLPVFKKAAMGMSEFLDNIDE